MLTDMFGYRLQDMQKRYARQRANAAARSAWMGDERQLTPRGALMGPTAHEGGGDALARLQGRACVGVGRNLHACSRVEDVSSAEPETRRPSSRERCHKAIDKQFSYGFWGTVLGPERCCCLTSSILMSEDAKRL